MPNDLPPADLAKRAAAARALEMVEDGMVLGLGTGSTAGWFVRLLSERMRGEGLRVRRRRDLERDGLARRGARACRSGRSRRWRGST